MNVLYTVLGIIGCLAMIVSIVALYAACMASSKADKYFKDNADFKKSVDTKTKIFNYCEYCQNYRINPIGCQVCYTIDENGLPTGFVATTEYISKHNHLRGSEILIGSILQS